MIVPHALRWQFLGALACLGMLNIALAAPDTQQAEQAVKERLALAGTVRQQYARGDAHLRLDQLKPSAEQVSVYQRFELAFAVEGRFDNPFDPDQIRIDAHITQPDGAVITVPAFFMAEYASRDGQTRLEGDVRYAPSTGQGWRLRFAPTQPGDYKVVLSATQASPAETITVPPVHFTATPAPHDGFVQVSRDNPRYFEYAVSGRLFYPVGVNVPWTRTRDNNPNLGAPHGTYEHYFAKAREQMSATRVWQCHYGWLEWMPQPGHGPGSSWSGYGGMNYYNQMVASAFDRIFELGEQADLRIMLVLDDNDEHDGPALAGGPPHGWALNPYNKVNGGPCESPRDVFSDPAARKTYQKRLRYIAARWGYSPALWAINVWNDTNKPHPAAVDWLAEMHTYTHGLFAGWRPMVFGTNYKFEAQAIADYAQPEQPLPEDKPSVVQEAYFTRNNKWFIDTVRVELWQAMARGHGGVMIWPHGMVDRMNAWDCFGSLKRFIEDVPLDERPVEPVKARIVSAAVKTTDRSIPQRVIAMVNYGDVPRWGAGATEDHFVIDVAAGNQFLMGISPKLYGERRAAWRTEPTFEFTLPASGEFIIELGMQLSGSNLKLVATNHGQPVRTFELDGSERRAVSRDHKFLRIPLDAGAHKLKLSLEGAGSDWIDVRRYLLVYEEPDSARLLNVDGLASSRHAVIFLRNVTCGELPEEAMGQTPAAMQNVELEVTGLADGQYEAVIWDIDAGKPRQRIIVTAAGGTVRMNLGDVDRHAAVRIVPSP